MTIEQDVPRHRAELVHNDSVTSTLFHTVTYWKRYEDKVMDDVLTRNFHTRAAAGEIIVNPLTYVVRKSTIPDDVASWKNELTGVTHSVDDCASLHLLRTTCGYLPRNVLEFPGTAEIPLDTGHELYLRKQAALAFIDKPQFDFGEDLAEITETVDLLVNPLKSLRKLLKAFNKDVDKALNAKGALLSFSRKAEAIAGIWAQYSFAIAPLMRSIEDLLVAVQAKSDLALRKTSRSKGTLEGFTTDQISGSHGGSPKTPAMSNTYEVTNVKTVSFHVGITYDAPQLDTVRNKLGLENKDLLITAWEIVPLSFMVDRIVSIKNVLSSLLNLADPNVEIKGGFVTKRVEEKLTVLATDWSIQTPTDSLVNFAPLPHVVEKFTMTREAWLPTLVNAVPIPNPKELVRTASHVADLASLVTLTLGPLIRKTFIYR
jgi:hypothetical protein